MLVLPSHPGAFAVTALATPSLELPVVVLLLIAAGRAARLSSLVRGLLLAALLASLVVKAADLALFGAFGRPFNLAYDLPLVHAGWMLLAGTNGAPFAAAYVALASMVFAALAWLLWQATGVIARAGLSRATLVPALALLAAAGTLGLAAAKRTDLPTARLFLAHAAAVREARNDLRTLAAEAAQDPSADITPDRLLAALRGRDIIVVFVESYGRSSLDNTLYAATTRHTLAEIDVALVANGLAARSAWLTSPTVGGQSWLAHATLLSGLWVNSQGRYGALPATGRKTLNRLAAEAGWRSVAVMPAITMAWPEAGYYGYDRVLAARDLGYRGLPFNWVTMPDQFTLASFERLELRPAARKPVFAEVALISSHAPWTPVPRLIPWTDVGDGGIFDAQARAGDTPRTVWASHDRVRDQFRQSIDYALGTIGSFATRRGATAPVFVILGDHQPAAFVSGDDTNRDVPVHIVADRDTVGFFDRWGWAEGMTPSASSPVWRMDTFRDRFLATFSNLPAKPREKDPAA